ncbi:helix-hairpin-helix domain-containing protein [Kitasatospora sp. NPDC008050]|uniref:helix-hairpin-helix domain-containing protein n=1 Tax=Kitasatospora sp. NPDC008050 TaxID=3364021 RepID=UPI0036EB2043
MANRLPDDWPHGYGRRAGRRRATSTPGADRAADPVADPVPAALGTVVPLDPLAVPSARHARRVGRVGFRWPGALQSLLWVDRKAVLGLVLLFLLAVGYAVQHFWFGRPQAVAVPVAAVGPVTRAVAQADPGALPEPAVPPEAAAQSEPAASAAPVAAAAADGSEPAAPPSSGPGRAAPALAPVVVDIAGRVTHPGVRTLTGGSRVADALRAAGGALPGVDTDGLNLARVLVDGEQVLVGAPAPPVAAQPSAAPKPPISLNRATLEQLDALPGVGPALAKHILDFRSSHGPFRSVEQLRQISGIGERKLSDLKPLLTL